MGSMKPSEMWDRAAKELKQGKQFYYNKETDAHCAEGALMHYRLGHEVCLSPINVYPSELTVDSEIIALKQAFCKRGYGILTLNDLCGWTFQQFADKARELGL